MRFSAPVQTGPGAHSASCTMGTGFFPGVKRGPHHLLVPWSGKGRAILLLPLWAVRPVQNLSACTRGQFTLPSVLRTGISFIYYRQCVSKATDSDCKFTIICPVTQRYILISSRFAYLYRQWKYGLLFVHLLGVGLLRIVRMHVHML